MLALSGGEVDAFVGNVASTSYWIRKLNLNNLKVAAPVSKEKQNLHFAVRNDWPELVSIIEKGLDSITVEEEEAIRQKWTSIKVDNEQSLMIVLRISAALFVIIIIGALWNMMLKRKVRQQTSQILRSAHYDQLTDLPNRFLIEDRLRERINEAKQNNSKVAMLSIDIDEFKKINDSYGHSAGDQVLKQVAERLGTTLTEGDTLGRLSGDQFLIIISHFNDVSDLASTTSSVLEQFRAAFQIDAGLYTLSASIGISIFPFDGDTSDELLKNADSATHVAKEFSNGSYAFYTTERKEKVSRQIELEQALRAALDKNEMYLVYQAKIDAQSKQVIGFEALLRWHSEHLGQVSPAEFIPVAERNGMIIPIGEFVIQQSLAALVELKAHYNARCTMLINISPVQFNSPSLIDVLSDTVSSSGIDYSSVEIEITEGVLMSSQSNTDFILNKITELGMKLAMDDFGQGYSSLSSLRKFSFNTLKIDREFINELPFYESDCKLVSAIILMAHGLDMKVVAEGVESQEQSDFLLECGCDSIQGWLYEKAEKLSTLLKHK